jgi:endonuclease/exonuclease/phosphatase family metal-dependent hydrolase
MRTKLMAVVVATMGLMVPGMPGAVGDPATEPAAPGARAAAPPTFTVMTWNVHYGVNNEGDYDLDAIRDRIVDANNEPDVVALQEIHRSHGPGEGPDDEPDNGHGDQIEQMKDLLAAAGYVDFYAPADRPGQLIASRYPLVRTKWIPLPEGVGHRGMLVKAEVDLPDGPNVRVYSTHLQAGASGAELANRRAEVRKIIDKRTIPELNDPVVLVGDFNLRPYHGLKSKLANRGFIDTWTLVRDGETGMTRTKSTDCTADLGEPVKRIDYVFGSPAIEATAGRIDCSSVVADHKPVVMTLRVDDKANQIEISGAVRAGARGKAGWAHLVVYEDKSSKLITCDNQAGAWGVRSYGYLPYRGTPYITGSDVGSHRGRCAIRNSVQTVNLRNLALKTCLWQEGEGLRDCRKRGLLERTYVGAERAAGHAQYRVGADNWVQATACDTKPDGWTVRAKVWDGRAHSSSLVAKVTSDGNGTCRGKRGPWPWAHQRLTTQTCLVRDGETRTCRVKPMAHAD